MAIAMKKTAAIAIAAGLTFAGSAGIAAQDALAQTMNNEPAVATDVKDASTIGDAPANLTIHKLVNPTELRNATGETDKDASGKPLPGVKFTAQKIKGDITDQATFNDIAKLANDRDIAGAEKRGLEGNLYEGTTNGDGVITWESMPVGAYLVKEVSAPEVKSPETETYVLGQPFIVFLPMTTPKGDDWNRDVHVYPKNSMAKVSKTVVDADKNTKSDGAGESGKPGFLGARPAENAVVEYTLDGVVPAAPEGRVLKNITLTDASKKEELQWGDDFIVSVERVRGEDKTPITEYTPSKIQELDPKLNNSNIAAGANQAFSVTVNPAEADLQPGDIVRVTVKATMLKDDTASKGIENSVNETFIFRNPKTETDDEPKQTPHDKVVTYVGDISVYKRGDENKPLAGAKFEIGKCNTNKDGFEGDAIQTGITNAEGNLTFPGLHVTDWINNAEPTETVANYCVKEIEAPKGYETPKGKAAVREIELKRDTAKALNEEKTAFDAAAADNVISNGAVIDNLKKTTPTLPATGGMGVLIIALAGLAIIGGGVYAARRNSQSA
ncbi:SpaH/EbpB family LPXTG-anchored major pilin [Corynebacterium coyleae]|uniref:SpaH/EbpB family LPXTG-anchored major pilin n=1 Tax=Corynebacterium coyleae TaxID=53374 RepID=UPI00254AA71F|nr:SpaH/EbpB family LPXTG-anchored major pilin [Corynebacterium coyleae]MDK8824109.1 SpaH/EbpB family LPXTG-anchored major pilin [Corynebacterium coyleae]